jgi:hypothetical protein
MHHGASPARLAFHQEASMPVAIPAHKQTNPAHAPGQIVNPTPQEHPMILRSALEAERGITPLEAGHAGKIKFNSTRLQAIGALVDRALREDAASVSIECDGARGGWTVTFTSDLGIKWWRTLAGCFNVTEVWSG